MHALQCLQALGLSASETLMASDQLELLPGNLELATTISSQVKVSSQTLVDLSIGVILILVWLLIQPPRTSYRHWCLGEAVIITRNGISRRQTAAPATFAPDIFEFVYFARPDSVIDGISVYRSRMAMGDALAVKVQAVLKNANIDIDVVIPVCIFSTFGSLY